MKRLLNKRLLKITTLASLLGISLGCTAINPNLGDNYRNYILESSKNGYPEYLRRNELDLKSEQLSADYYKKKSNKREIGTIRYSHYLEDKINGFNFTLENPTEFDHNLLMDYFYTKCTKNYKLCIPKIKDNALMLSILDYSKENDKKWRIPNDFFVIRPYYYDVNDNLILFGGSKINTSPINLKEIIDEVKSLLNISLSKEAQEVYNTLK